MKIVMWLAGILVLLVSIAVGGHALYGDTPKWQDREAIERCWDVQAKKSLDPSTARFAASVCEKMEDKFLTAYGVKP